MMRIQQTGRRAYVLDTNVLMHDPAALFRFEEHDVILPLPVLEELDRLKAGTHENARSARQVSRTLGRLLDRIDAGAVAAGVPLGPDGSSAGTGGRLFFLVPEGDPFAGATADDRILSAAARVVAERPQQTVILVSNDINLRVKCAALGLRAEDYRAEQVLDDIDAMASGMVEIPVGALTAALRPLTREDPEWPELGGMAAQARVYTGDGVSRLTPGLWLCPGGAGETDPGFLVHSAGADRAVLIACRDHRQDRAGVWGAQARSRRQNAALNMLLADQYDLVTLAGAAGTGKTYLALAAGLHQVLDAGRQARIVVTRETVAMGEDIGFLPGTEEEKMGPWMGGIQDNLDALIGHQGGWAAAATRDTLSSRVLFRSLSFMRSRTFNDTFLIIDEAQNLSAKQMRNLISRAGRNTRIVCLGNVNQIDSPYLTAASSGLTYVVERFRNWPHAAHLTLQGVERSRLAMAAESLL